MSFVESVSDTAYSSSSDSSTDIEDKFGEFIIMSNLYEHYQCSMRKQPCRTSTLTGFAYVQELLHGHPGRIFDSSRMEPHVYKRLCFTLKTLNLLEDDRHVCIEEAIAILLLTRIP